ncbi:MAG: rod shape-determining protein MreC [Chitinivibrionales bacterium]|nr:rod shape-determining protein MreC [Chitinivibrionales bacterium]
MHWILQFIVENRNISSLFLTVVLSLWMLSSNQERQNRISQALLVSIFYPFQYSLNLTSNIKNIFAENKQLRAEVTHLSTRVAELEQAAKENERLKKMLGMEDDFEYALEPARVVVRNPSHQLKSIVISAGKKHRLQRYMPVIHKSGVVGKIIHPMHGISMVQLLKDPACRTSVMFVRTRTAGILETDNGEDFFILCRTHADIRVSDTVKTSGLGGVFPKGLLVGEVIAIKDDQEPLFKRVYIKPFVDFSHLEEVFVIKLPPQWSAFRTEIDSLKEKNGI